MLWIKALHIVFIASWFACVFYLPRIFVNLAQVPPESTAEYERLLGMASRLLRFGVIIAIPALGFGIWLWAVYGIGANQPWFHAKMAVVVLTIGYYHACARLLTRFRNRQNQRSHRWYRWFNEVPVLLMLAGVVLVVVKPWG